MLPLEEGSLVQGLLIVGEVLPGVAEVVVDVLADEEEAVVGVAVIGCRLSMMLESAVFGEIMEC